MRVRLLVLAALMLVLVPLSAHAGWVVTERTDKYGWMGPDEYVKGGSTESKSYLDKGRIRSNEGGEGTGTDEGWTVFDMERDRILTVNSKRRVYYEGSLKEWVYTMKKVAEDMQKMAEAMKGMPGMEEALAKPVIKKLGSGGRIAGYPTVKYRVTKGGSLDKVVWVTPSGKLPREIRKMNERMTEIMRSTGLQIEDLELQAMGIEVKTEENFQYDRPTRVTTVVSIKKEKIPASVFRAPKGYRRAATMEEFSSAGEEERGGFGGPPEGFTSPSVPMMGGSDDDAADMEQSAPAQRRAVEQDPYEESGWGRRRAYDEGSDEGSGSMDEMGDKAKEMLKGIGGLFGK